MRIGLALIDDLDVAGRMEIAPDDDDGVATHGGAAYDFGTARNRVNAAPLRPRIQMDAALVLGQEVQCAAVRRPFQVPRLAVEPGRTQGGIAAVDGHCP